MEVTTLQKSVYLEQILTCAGQLMNHETTMQSYSTQMRAAEQYIKGFLRFLV